MNKKDVQPISIQRKLNPKTPFIQAKNNGTFFSASNKSTIQQKEDANMKEGSINEGIQLKSAVGNSNPYNSTAPLVGLNEQKTVQQKPASGGGTKLPPSIQAKMENSFGADFSDVNIHKDSKSAQDAGALAYAQGTDLHFAPGQFKLDKPGQKLLGHELTHVLQQKQGRVKATKQMKGKGGPIAYNDDPALEREADVMGEKAANGEKVQMKMNGTLKSSLTKNTIQRYTAIGVASQRSGEWDLGSNARVADNGLTITSDVDPHLCYAEQNLIKNSNKILKAKKSGIELNTGSTTITGSAPDGSGKKTLVKVNPNIKVSSPGASPQDFWTDCGRSSREVMGETGTDTAPKGIYKDNSGNLNTTSSSKNPAKYRDEILINAGLGTDAASARSAYLALSPSEKEDFDKKHQINKYADPKVGEAFVSRRDDASTSKGFNFHWGGVVIEAGHDKVTLENFAKTGTTYHSKDTDWYFETFGPPSKSGQTFHEKNEGSVGEIGKNNTTMTATTSGLGGNTDFPNVHLVADPNKYASTRIGKLSTGTKVKILRRGNSWYKVKVLEGPFKNQEGWIMKNFFTF